MKCLSACAAALLFGALCVGQFLAPPSPDTFTTVQGPLGVQVRFKTVETGPGSICEQHGSVKSLSGYVDIAPHEHYFFWFFAAREADPGDAHLTAWISGGPGASSMSELMTEHGPCRITEDLQPVVNPYSWNRLSNVVYIDQPTTVGFSYTDAVPAQIDSDSCALDVLPNNTCPVPLSAENDCDNYGESVCGTFPRPNANYTAHSTEGAAPKFWLALQGIFAALPEYTKSGFTLASESYGGHYAPVFSDYIAKQNRNLPPGAIHVPLQSVMVNNGWFDPAVAYTAQYQFLVSPGNTFDVKLPNNSSAERMRKALYGDGQCLDRLKQCNSPNGTDKTCRDGDQFCTDHVQNVYGRQLARDEYDIRELDPSPFPNGYYVNYLNTERVLSELGAFTNFTDQSDLVDTTFYETGDDGKELGITAALASLLDSGVSITLLHGDADYDAVWYGGETMVGNIANRSQTSAVRSGYRKAGFQNLSTTDGVVHGQVKQVGRLSFVRVFEAGHQVGFFQPLAEQAIFERTIGALDIATGQHNVTLPIDGHLYQSTGPVSSTYREGNRTVQNHVLPDNAVYNTTTNEPEVPSD